MSATWTRTAIIPDDGDFADTLRRTVARGFTHVEIEGREERPIEHLEALADTGLFVAAVRLGAGVSAEDIEARRSHLARLKRMTNDAARLGATYAILQPTGTSERAWTYFLEGAELLASAALAQGVRLAVIADAEIALPVGIGLALDSPEEADVRAALERVVYVRRPTAAAVRVLSEVWYSGFVAEE